MNISSEIGIGIGDVPHVVNGILGVSDSLVHRFKPNKRPLIRERNIRWYDVTTLVVGNDFECGVSNYPNARICPSEINANN